MIFQTNPTIWELCLQWRLIFEQLTLPGMEKPCGPRARRIRARHIRKRACAPFYLYAYDCTLGTNITLGFDPLTGFVYFATGKRSVGQRPYCFRNATSQFRERGYLLEVA